MVNPHAFRILGTLNMASLLYLDFVNLIRVIYSSELTDMQASSHFTLSYLVLTGIFINIKKNLIC